MTTAEVFVLGAGAAGITAAYDSRRRQKEESVHGVFVRLCPNRMIEINWIVCLSSVLSALSACLMIIFN